MENVSIKAHTTHGIGGYAFSDINQKLLFLELDDGGTLSLPSP